MALLLGTNGIRATYDELNPATALDLGFGFANFIKKISLKKRPSIAIGQDMRLTSPALASATIAGILEAGCDVYDFGLVPSPVAEWGRQRYFLDGLVIVTASHNPPEWNALKFVDNDGIAISSERGEAICDFLNKPHPKLSYKEVGSVFDYSNKILEEYKNSVLKFVKQFEISKLKVVVDVGNGTSTLILPSILKELGMEVIILNEKLDGTFPSRPSEPNEENLKKLIETVKKTKADFGIGLDGDADRITFVDEKGCWIIGDKCLGICAWWLLEQKRKKISIENKSILTTYATSKVVEEIASLFNVSTIYTDIGAPYLSEKIFQLKEKCLIAGEEVGGIVFPDFSIAKDGILTGSLLCAIVNQKPLSSWLKNLPTFFNWKIKLPVLPSEKEKLIKKVFEKIQQKYHNPIILKNGFRINFNDSWVLVRASGTENYIRIFAEAKKIEEAKKLCNDFESLIKGRN